MSGTETMWTEGREGKADEDREATTADGKVMKQNVKTLDGENETVISVRRKTKDNGKDDL